MADVDIDSFVDHDKMDTQPDKTGTAIPLNSGGGPTLEPKHKQETSFGGKAQRTRLKEAQAEGLYPKLFESIGQTTEAYHFDNFNNFELRDGNCTLKARTYL